MSLDRDASAMRRFNRFYTREIGVLEEKLLSSRFSLTEVRVLFELAHRQQPRAQELRQELGLDAAYLSRILGRFEEEGLLRRERDTNDARQFRLSLTDAGRREFHELDQRSQEQVRARLSGMRAADRELLIQSLQTAETLLGAAPVVTTPVVIRQHRAGDMGWVVSSHGELYAREYGWDPSFEALVAEIAAAFIRNFDPARERCWIAERRGERVGSIFLVKKTSRVAKLRLLLVDPSARGIGLGHCLVNECIKFAREAGYSRITLWTQSNLTAARRIYQSTGFQLVSSEPNHSFGHDLVSETWELVL